MYHVAICSDALVLSPLCFIVVCHCSLSSNQKAGLVQPMSHNIFHQQSPSASCHVGSLNIVEEQKLLRIMTEITNSEKVQPKQDSVQENHRLFYSRPYTFKCTYIFSD